MPNAAERREGLQKKYASSLRQAEVARGAGDFEDAEFYYQEALNALIELNFPPELPANDVFDSMAEVVEQQGRDGGSLKRMGELIPLRLVGKETAKSG